MDDTLRAPPHSLQVVPTELDFGLTGLQRSFTVATGGWWPVEFSIVGVVDLEVSPLNGVVYPGVPITVSVTTPRCCANWQPGTRELSIVVDADTGDRQIVAVTIDVPAPPSESTVVAWLEDLPPLPRVHHSWPANLTALGVPNGLLAYHWVRITRCLGISARWINQSQVHDAVALCKWVNDDDPTVNATIALNYSPYHYIFPGDYPPTYTGTECLLEERLCEQSLMNVKAWIAQANQALGTNVQVSAILLDTELELWYTQESDKRGAQSWNEALDAKYDAMYWICKSVFPDVPVDWFQRGAPCCPRRFTTNEQGDSYNAVCYWPSDLQKMRTRFKDYYDQAQADGVSEMQTWVSIGGRLHALGPRRLPVDLRP